MTAAYLRTAALELSWADASRSLQDLIFSVARRALDESGVEFERLDSVVLAAHDMVDGRSLSSMVSAPAAGSYLRDEIRLSDDAAAAVATASMRVRAGLSRECMVCAWARASEGDGERISTALFDPFYARPLGLTELSVSALRASVALREFPAYAGGREAAAERRAGQAAEDPRAPAGHAAPVPAPLPLRAAELPRVCDIVCALIVSAERTDVRIAGHGMSCEPYWPGDRDLLALPALRDATERALRSAARAPAEVSLYELDGLTLFDEALALEAVGGARHGQGMASVAEAMNPCGGYALGYCAPAMGLVRVAEAARRLRERGAGLALASGSSTVAAQTQTALVLECEP
ncbi:MAG TPA: hypothetical protein VHX88_13990 [Solirubrobacteraceae bacterium]|nr:hypothetical protein [Solirubrobacteraceae bacterium]